MKSSFVKYPKGIQSFSSLRKEGYIYVDKTEYVYRLATMGKAIIEEYFRHINKHL